MNDQLPMMLAECYIFTSCANLESSSEWPSNTIYKYSVNDTLIYVLN